jgi:CRP-like cAMP-binding protein
MSVARALLLQWSLFADLDAGTLERLGRAMELRHCPRRKLVLASRDRGSHLGLVVQGRVQAIDFTLDGREYAAWSAAPGEFFAETAVFAPETADQETFVAVVESVVALMPGPVARELVLDCPVLAMRLLERMARKLSHMQRIRRVLVSPNAGQRVCAALLLLARGQGDDAERRQLAEGLTQQEIAAYANTTRETVTRVMQRLQAENMVQRDGQNWIVDLQKLARAVTQAG